MIALISRRTGEQTVAGIFPRLQLRDKKIVGKNEVCLIKCDGLDIRVIFLDNFLA